MRINLILLAAGYSRRFSGRKLLAEVNGRPLYLITLEKLEFLCKKYENWKIIVVTSYPEIAACCEKHKVAYTKNEGKQNTGIASSIQKALFWLEQRERDLDAEKTADVFFAADQPLSDIHEIEKFLLAYAAQDKKLGTLECNGIWRNPNVFDVSYRPFLHALHKDQGGKYLLKQHAYDVFCYHTEDDTCFFDIDTPEDYKQLVNSGTLRN